MKHGSTQIQRRRIVTAMNEIVISLNNEDAYSEWIAVVPDMANDDDFEYIAQEDELYTDATKLFLRIMKDYADDGIYDGEVNITI